MRRLALAALLVLSPIAASAGTTGTLTGAVRDDRTAAPIANAIVVASSSSQIESTRSDAHGNFSFVSLTPDIYSLSINRVGYEPVLIPSISIFADTSLHVTPRMMASNVYIVHVDRINRVVTPGATSDRYLYSPSTISPFPPTRGNDRAIIMTPGITFGAGAPMAH